MRSVNFDHSCTGYSHKQARRSMTVTSRHLKTVSDANYSLKQEGRQRLHFAAWKDLLQYFCGPEKLSTQKNHQDQLVLSILIEPCLTCIGKWQKILSPIILPLRQWQWTLEHQKSTLRSALTLKAIENQSNRRVHKLIVNITNRRATCFPRWQYFMLIYIQMAWTSFSLNICITARFLWLESALISDICKSTFSLSITCITAAGSMADLLQEKSPSEEGH